MKKQIYFYFIMISLLMQVNFKIIAQESQEKCKVLLETISESYQGGCKNGLAHGKGIANGIDKYEGKFKEGLPNGKGKYYWSNGDYYEGYWEAGKKNGEGILYNAVKNSTLKGIWKDDEFIKKIEEPPYKILQMSHVSSVTIREKTGGTPGTIELIFNKDGREVAEVNSLMLSSTSGIVSKSLYYNGFDNVIFPFEGTINFDTMNMYQTVTIRCDVKIRINKAGAWRVNIRY